MNVVLGAVGSVAIGAVVVGVAAVVLHSAPTTPPTLEATLTNSTSSIPGVQKTASIHLSTYPDSGAITWRRTANGVGPHPDWVSYGPTTVLQLPAHALITVTIDQYDSGAEIPNTFLAQVHGTVGGTETVNGKVVKEVDANHVGHTFTIHNFPSSQQDTLFVNVPLPALPDGAQPAAGSDYPKPNVVTFQFTTGSTGTYAWNCEFPCGDNYAGFGGAMGSYGYMSGTIHVV